MVIFHSNCSVASCQRYYIPYSHDIPFYLVKSSIFLWQIPQFSPCSPRAKWFQNLRFCKASEHVLLPAAGADFFRRCHEGFGKQLGCLPAVSDIFWGVTTVTTIKLDAKRVDTEKKSKVSLRGVHLNNSGM